MAHSEHDRGLHAVAISDRVEDGARRVARTWAVTAVVMLLLLGFSFGFPHSPDLEAWEKAAQFATLGLLIAGVLIAWRWEGLGGAILLIGAAALWGLAALQHQPAMAFLPGIMFIVPAVAFLVAWNRTKSAASLIVLATAVAMILVVGGTTANVLYERGYGAAHPESDLPPLADSPVVWIWSGGVTDQLATVVGRVASDASVTLALTADGTTNLHAASPRGDVWRFNLTGLSPDTDYSYHLVVDGVPILQRSGTFSTFAPGPASFTVAAASCARLGSNGAVYEAIAAAKPDVFISTGDLFYADYVETADHFTHAYESSLTQPAQAALFSSVPIAYVWDDHDYGRNNSDSTSPTRQLALDAYQRNVPHYPMASSDAIYQSFSIGRVQFVLLDDRSQRDPGSNHDGPDKTMLGDEQLRWLEQRLLDDSFALTVIVNQVPWITDPEPGADHWGGYTYERQRIANLIAEHGLDNILMVGGDAHMVAIDDGTNTDYSVSPNSNSGDASFPLLQAAALDRPGSTKGGPYSEGAYAGAGQFGLIEVTDTGGATIDVRLIGMTWAGDVRVQYKFTVDTR
ncbi:MAG: alkaline phosphatase family protein [bacterium]|nr:alkaline phosphatase family protein [bacterium]